MSGITNQMRSNKVCVCTHLVMLGAMYEVIRAYHKMSEAVSQQQGSGRA